MKKHLALIIFLSLLALWPFFRKGYFETHDGEWMIIRFTAFHQTLASGQFPVRFVDRLNNNYGYPLFNFVYPSPFYLAEISKLFGFGFVDSIKIVFVLATISSSIAMYWGLSQIFSKWASAAGAVVYLYSPYRFTDIYVRGSIGEVLAFGFLPIIFGCIIKIGKQRKTYLPILAISIALLIISHNLIAAIVVPFFIIFSVFLVKKNNRQILSAFILGILISAFFWIPAIYDLQFVSFLKIKMTEIPNHLVSITDLIIPRWNYGPLPQSQGGFSVQIGLVSLAILTTSIYLQIKSRRKIKLVNFLIISILVSAFLMTRYSSIFWQTIPKAEVIQYPWRLLFLITLATAILCAYIVDYSKKKTVVAGSIIFFSFISTISYTRPVAFINRPDNYYATNEDTTAIFDEYQPLWVREKPQDRANQKIEVGQDATIVSSKIEATNYQAVIKASDKTTVRVNTIFFPGWKASVDGNDVDITYQDNDYGLMSFKLPKGEHKVIIKYGKTPVHLASEIISLVALIATGCYFIYLWRKQNS